MKADIAAKHRMQKMFAAAAREYIHLIQFVTSMCLHFAPVSDPIDQGMVGETCFRCLAI